MREFRESCSGVVQKNKRKVALTCDKSLANPKLALARLLRKFFQNLRYGRERPKVARKLRSLAGGWAPLYGRAAAEEIFSEVI